MRTETLFATALLATSTLALRIGGPMGPKPPKGAPAAEDDTSAVKITGPFGPKTPKAAPADPPAADDSTSAAWVGDACGSFAGTDLSAYSNDAWASNFDTSALWYANMKDFWTTFDADSAFQYFDCGYGNGDGVLTYDEFRNGQIGGGFMTVEDCNSDMNGSFQDFFGVSGNTVTWDDIQTNSKTWKPDMWKAITGDQKNQEASYATWMQGTNMNMGMDQLSADTIFMRAAGERSPYVTKQQFYMAFNSMTKDLWNYYNQQYLVTADGVLGMELWYFTESCFGAAAYWTALSNDPALEAYKNTVNYTSDAWAAQLCSVYQLC